MISFAPPLTTITLPITLGTSYIDSSLENVQILSIPEPPTITTLNDTIIGVGYGTLKLKNNVYNNVLCVYHSNYSGSGYCFFEKGVNGSLLNFNKISSNFGYTDSSWITSYLVQANLPLEITSFTTTWKNKTPYLVWNAVNTENTKYFDVQRSTNGNDFSTIGQVPVNPNSSSYHFEDTTLVNNKVYYRLQQIDKDGKAFYSNISTLQPTGPALNVNIFPNPAQNSTTIQFNKPTNKATIAVCDLTGKVVISKSFTEPINTYKLNTESLPNGTYMVLIETSTNSFNQKLLINK